MQGQGGDFDFSDAPSCLNLNAPDLRRKPDLYQPRCRIAVLIICAVEHVELHLADASTERAEDSVKAYRTNRARAIAIAQNKIVVMEASFPDERSSNFPQDRIQIV